MMYEVTVGGFTVGICTSMSATCPTGSRASCTFAYSFVTVSRRLLLIRDRNDDDP